MSLLEGLGVRVTSLSQPVGQILLDFGLIDEGQLQEVLEIQKDLEAQGKGRQELGRLISDRFGISEFIIEGLFIREYLIKKAEDLLYEALKMDMDLDAEKVLEISSIKLLSWEAELTESIRFKERVDVHSEVKTTSNLQWVKGELSFQIQFESEDQLTYLVPFSYKSGSQPQFDLEPVLTSLRFRLLGSEDNDEFTMNDLGMSTDEDY